jgi:hypothetical protein
MPRTFIACCVISVAATAAYASQDERPKPPKKGDTVVVKGCLRGNALEAAEMIRVDAEGEKSPDAAVPLMTYRLDGKKDLLKEMREKHDRRTIEVKGVLRSELSGSGIGKDVGRTRITIGVDPRNRSPHHTEQVIPVVEARSFEASTESCGK